MLRALALLLTCVYTLSAQESVPTPMLYHKVWAIVPIVGKGTEDDPRRPMFVPSPAELREKSEEAARQFRSTGKKPEPETPVFLSYVMQLSDDKQSALVEFTGISPKAMAAITSSTTSGVKIFERGKTSKAEIEAEFGRYKRDFNLEKLSGGAK